MGLFSGFYIGKESLNTHGTAIATVADNLANQNTPGFKDERVDFEDMLADSLGGLYSGPFTGGEGVKIDGTTRSLAQGAILPTDRSLDLAIQGNGFFVVNDADASFYTRAGNFGTDEAGNIVTQDGLTLMGYTAASPDVAVPLTLANIGTGAAATTAVNIEGRIQADSALTVAPAAAPATWGELNAQTTFRSPVNVYDSLGQVHSVSLHFFHTANGAWTAQAYVDSADTTGVPGTPVLLGQTPLAFDGAGAQAAGAATAININPAWANGANPAGVQINLGNLSQLAGPSNFNAVTADGSEAGGVKGAQVKKDGTLVALLTSGREVPIGTVLLANFNNPQGLEKQGNNLFIATESSGDALIGAPQLQGRGDILGSSLENSTVDMAAQFVDMVRFQRGYQAGSSIIKTVNEIVQQTIQIV